MSRIIFQKVRFYALNSILQIIDENFHERDPLNQLYQDVILLCEYVVDNQILENKMLSYYVLIEYEILNNLGYGIDVSSCTVTLKEDDLIYVSPNRDVQFLRVGQPIKIKFYSYQILFYNMLGVIL